MQFCLLLVQLFPNFTQMCVITSYTSNVHKILEIFNMIWSPRVSVSHCTCESNIRNSSEKIRSM